MHHSRHHPGHSHKCEILYRKIHAEAEIVDEVGKEEPCHAPYVKRGGECASHSACAVCCRSGERFHKDYEPDIEDYECHIVAVAIKNRAVDD